MVVLSGNLQENAEGLEISLSLPTAIPLVPGKIETHGDVDPFSAFSTKTVPAAFPFTSPVRSPCLSPPEIALGARRKALGENANIGIGPFT